MVILHRRCRPHSVSDYGPYEKKGRERVRGMQTVQLNRTETERQTVHDTDRQHRERKTVTLTDWQTDDRPTHFALQKTENS